MDHDDNVTKKLRAIEAGGQQLVMQARQRVAKILDALDEGDFGEAYAAAGLVGQSLGALANAETYIAVAGDSRLVEARDLELGMILADVGEITDVHKSECPAEACPGHVKINIGTHEVDFRGSTELYVKDPETAEAGSGSADDDEPDY